MTSHVDDFILVGPNKHELQDLTKSLDNELSLNDLGQANWFLGVRIRRSSLTGSVMLDQELYRVKFLTEMYLETKKDLPITPMLLSSKSDLKKNTSKVTAQELYDYQRLIGIRSLFLFSMMPYGTGDL